MKFSGGRRRVFTIKAGRETGDMQRFETGQMATDGAVAYVDSLAEFVKLRQRELLGEPVENTTEIIGASQLRDIRRCRQLRHQQAAVSQTYIDDG